MYRTDDTIAAIATAAAGGARGIVRLSGPAVVETLQHCFTAASDDNWSRCAAASVFAGELTLHEWPGAEGAARVPCDLYFWPGTRSYTRQPSAELHVDGCRPLLAAIVAALCAAGARLAEPGEFTLRAFLAGRLDLTQAEAVLGVIEAGGRGELETALRQMAGGLARPLHELRDSLLNLLAELEAGLDFVEEDIRFVTPRELDDRLARAEHAVQQLLDQLAARGTAGQLSRVVLVGNPNVGKSSLFNALSDGPSALVSGQPGTTRDYLARRLDLSDGLACELVDTAGLHDCGQPSAINVAAESMTAEQRRQSEVELLCFDATRSLLPVERERLAENGDSAARLLVLTKCDLSNPGNVDAAAAALRRLAANSAGDRVVATSAATGAGMAELKRRLGEALQAANRTTHGAVATTAERCHESLRAAVDALGRSRDLLSERAGEELIAAELRAALDELGQVAGAVYTDDILDRIFSQFCIGK